MNEQKINKKIYIFGNILELCRMIENNISQKECNYTFHGFKIILIFYKNLLVKRWKRASIELDFNYIQNGKENNTLKLEEHIYNFSK